LEDKTRPVIAIDAMGGDFAPLEIIRGALLALESIDAEIVLFGNEKQINDILDSELSSSSKLDLKNIKVINSTDDIKMDDSPSEVLKHRKNSSIFMGTEFAARTKECAFISAGNTGAVMACSLINMKKIEGILRPAIATVIPLGEKKFVLLDSGANSEIKPLYFKQFAIMGTVYSREILKIKDPKTGLLNVGSEEKKGTEPVVEGYKLLKESELNFIGNVEGRDIFNGAADVVVTDGFTGNILLKSIEGMANFFFTEIKNIFLSNFLTKISALMVKKELKAMKKRFDYEEYGGALLLGIDGVSIISHGSSKAKAIKNAIRVAAESLKAGIVNKIKNEVQNQ
jgi:glycerol-3-phosphate acyltransferase PlsX